METDFLIACVCGLTVTLVILAWAGLQQQTQMETQIMDTLNSLNARLAGIEAKLDEASAELVGEITQLREQLTNVTLPADALETLARIEAKSAALADVIPTAEPEATEA